MDETQELHPAVRGLKTVCRCNNIKYRTIERAIRHGACTVGEVASRTGATTGHCGGSCTPDILEMLAECAPAAAPVKPVQPPGANADAWWVRKQ